MFPPACGEFLKSHTAARKTDVERHDALIFQSSGYSN